MAGKPIDDEGDDFEGDLEDGTGDDAGLDTGVETGVDTDVVGFEAESHGHKYHKCGLKLNTIYSFIGGK
ncbi:hypothetical protein BG006_003270 [Podila minutissima]|uniref:Uncharacterized protein n=1 Tax=Podila minutissima TaxID=64525 RepID=A0A9P5SNF4_9FUNG|nr:hypothetical protein BG006_003270 [Podila minutissima]